MYGTVKMMDLDHAANEFVVEKVISLAPSLFLATRLAQTTGHPLGLLKPNSFKSSVDLCFRPGRSDQALKSSPSSETGWAQI